MYESLSIRSGYWGNDLYGRYNDPYTSPNRYDPSSGRRWVPYPLASTSYHSPFIDVEEIEDILLEIMDSGSKIIIADTQMINRLESSSRSIIARFPLSENPPNEEWVRRGRLCIRNGQEISIYISTRIAGRYQGIPEPIMKKITERLQYLGIHLLDIKEEKKHSMIEASTGTFSNVMMYCLFK